MAKKRVYSNFIGSFYSVLMDKAIKYYSNAERIVLYWLELKCSLVKSYSTQELQIPVFIGADCMWMYTPDIEVEYLDGSKEIIEVKKTRADVEKRINEIKQIAGEKFCKQQGWKYSVICEEDFSDVLKRNLKFIFGFRNRSKNYYTWGEKIIEMLTKKHMNIQEIINKLGTKEALPVIYYMISRNELTVDMEEPISLTSMVTLNN